MNLKTLSYDSEEMLKKFSSAAIFIFSFTDDFLGLNVRIILPLHPLNL
jgi:hypothetical protein